MKDSSETEEKEVLHQPVEKGKYNFYCKKCGYAFAADNKDSYRYLVTAHKQTLCAMKRVKLVNVETGKETLAWVRENFEFSLPAIQQAPTDRKIKDEDDTRESL